MNGKFRIPIAKDLDGVIKISLEVPQNERPLAAARGYGIQELENAIGQKFQEIVDLLALDEEGT